MVCNMMNGRPELSHMSCLQSRTLRVFSVYWNARTQSLSVTLWRPPHHTQRAMLNTDDYSLHYMLSGMYIIICICTPYTYNILEVVDMLLFKNTNNMRDNLYTYIIHTVYTQSSETFYTCDKICMFRSK